MLEENRIEFDSALLKIAKMYGYALDKEQAGLYFEILREYSINDVKTGFLKCARSLKFFPKPSEIIEAIDASAGNKLDYDFEYCKSMIKEVGFHSSVILPSKILMVVISDLGGLQAFSDAIYSDEKDTYFRFKRVYQRRQTDAANNSLPEITRLIGYMESIANQSAYPGLFQITFWDNKKLDELPGGPEQKKLEAPDIEDDPGKVSKIIGGLVKKLEGGGL
jgi:hypothetical protein